MKTSDEYLVGTMNPLRRHSYLTRNRIGNLGFNREQAFAVLKLRFGLIFPWRHPLWGDASAGKWQAHNPQEIAVGRVFHLPGHNHVMVTELDERNTYFVVTTMRIHILTGTVTHKLTEDASGCIWMLQYGEGADNLLQRAINYSMAGVMWKAFADNFADYLKRIKPN